MRLCLSTESASRLLVLSCEVIGARPHQLIMKREVRNMVPVSWEAFQNSEAPRKRSLETIMSRVAQEREAADAGSARERRGGAWKSIDDVF